ncbi:hypothetical protein NQ317_004168 [Molorchus minor]|uniref:G-protein coupled receptors family 2 profile 2 domain-containing protein n=1 Tax=Molorchus minor TaxID=1323400 RepID=A0ABQ9JT03_9CUCU|nr:hypothetical protein NQ317_004168 [Molorchus minor]
MELGSGVSISSMYRTPLIWVKITKKKQISSSTSEDEDLMTVRRKKEQERDMDSELCIALAFALQYARMCVFCWMLMMTHNMHHQFRTGLHLVPITDNRITRNFIRYSLIGWGLPFMLLGASVLIQSHDKAGKLLDTASLKRQNCWFLDKNAFVYGLLVPGCVLIGITFYYLVHRQCSPLHNQHAGRHTDEREDEAQKDTPDTSIHESKL